MYDHVLVPVVFDHEGHGADAIRIAQELITDNGTITLLHVLEDVPSYVMTYIPENVLDKHQEHATGKLNDLAKEVQTECNIAVVHGHASNSILSFGEANGVDCIVVASHKPGFEDFFLGSTAARVVRHAQCAVHVMR